MPFHFCLSQPDGTLLCFDIPVLVLELPIDPGPDPTILIRGPRPNPWVQGQGITPEIATTLANMATVMEVAERLGGEVPAMMGQMFMEQINRMQLPTGTRIEITRRKSA